MHLCLPSRSRLRSLAVTLLVFPSFAPAVQAPDAFDEENRRGQAIDSIVSGGCILSGGMVRNSVLGPTFACIPEPWWRIA